MLEENAVDTGLARRKYDFIAGESKLTVVNDASIRSSVNRTPLAGDIDQAVGAGNYFLGCVNRGILVEEAHALEDDDSAGASVVRWLAGAPGLIDSSFTVSDSDSSPLVLRSATLVAGDVTIELVAVHVDFCSLLERRPEVDASLNASVYKVSRLKDRAEMTTATMPAAALLNKIAGHVAGATYPESGGLDPVRANVESLAHESVQRGLLTLLRSSEAVAGARMTFREIWGAILRALVGDLPSQGGPELLEGAFPPPPNAATAHAAFIKLRERANLRFSQTLFGVGVPAEQVASDPVLRFTAAIDPTFDAVPGRLESGNVGAGWASPVLDAFSGLISSASPLELLIGSLPEGDAFQDAVTEFDWILDAAFVAATQPDGVADKERGEKERREMVAWYGDYLTRLYAVSNGVSAFRPEVAAWLDARSSSLPSALEQDLKTLLRPTRDPTDAQSGYFLPLFSSRTVPLTGAVSEPVFALKGESVVDLEPQRRGDEVTLEMREGGKIVGEIELDFALIRSALACSNSRLGMTEQAARVGPRVERFRAKRLTPGRVADSTLRLVHGNDVSDVYLEA